MALFRIYLKMRSVSRRMSCSAVLRVRRLGLLISAMLYVHLAVADVSMSIADMEKMLESEQRVVGLLNEFIQAEEEKLEAIKRYTSWYPVFANRSAEELVSHPVDLLRVTRHLSLDWDYVREYLKYDLAEAAAKDVEILRTLGGFPKEEDWKNTALGIYRMQRSYQIDTESFANGSIPGSNNHTTPLTALERFFIGRILLQEPDATELAISWLESALRAVDLEETEDFVFIPKENILDWLQHAYHNEGDLVSAAAITNLIGEMNPNFPTLWEKTEQYSEELERLSVYETEHPNTDRPEKNLEAEHLDELCRGEGRLVVKVLQQQRCYLETYNSPFLLLQPVKTEVMHLNPDIFLLHELFFSRTMERLKWLSRPFIVSGMATDPYSGELSLDRQWVSKKGFVPDAMDPVFREVSVLIGIYSNLDHRQSDPIMAQNYGLGGHVSPHHDYSDPPGPRPAHLGQDHMASFLIYLSDVQAGGATIFPRLNITIFPEKGSAALFFNHYRDGTRDPRTLHSDCPVLLGNKWVANKWFYQAGQDVTRPCGLTRNNPENFW